MLLIIWLKEKKEWLFPDRLRSFLIRRVKINIFSLCAFQAILWWIIGNICVLDWELRGSTARDFSLCQCIGSVSLEKKRKKGFVDQKGDWPQKGESSKQRELYLSKQYPRKVLAGGLSILAIRSLFPIVRVTITECQ